MARIHHYGHRDRAERTPGSHDAFMAACALAALAVGCGLVVGAGLLDGLVFAGEAPSLRHRSLPQIVAQVFTHAKHPYRAFAPAATGPVTSPWAYWVMFALLAVIVAAAILWGVVRFGRWGSKTHAGFASSATVRRVASARAAAAKRAQTRPDLAGQHHQAAAPVRLPAGPGRHLRGCRHARLVGVVADHLWTARKRQNLPAAGPDPERPPGPGHRHVHQGRHLRSHRLGPPAEVGPVAVLDPEGMAPGRSPGALVGGARLRGHPHRRAASGRPHRRRTRAAPPLDTGNSAFFKASALSVLKTFLHAAALGGKTIVDVTRWCRGDYSGAEAILAGQADPLVDPAGQLTQHTIGAEETTSGVMRYVENTLACFSHRSVIDLCTPSPDDDFDMRPFRRGQGTVYLLGKGEKLSSASALTTAFAEELLFVAGDVIAPARPGRRLTPPLLACLDEAPSVAPIPSLPLHLADARGRGIVVIVSAQSPSQLRTKWSDAGGRNHVQRLHHQGRLRRPVGRPRPGLAVRAGRAAATCSDHTRQTRPDWRTHYSSHWDEVPVLRPDEIRTLSPGHALVMFSATAPVITDLPLIFDTRGGRQVLARRHCQDHGRPERPGPSRQPSR